MNAQWRLDSKAPALADAFRRVSPEYRQRAAFVAAESVAAIVELDGDDVRAALDALRARRPADPSLAASLGALASRLDDEYFRLNEEGDDASKAEALRLFSKARAASALALALASDAAQLHEAIYEALSAVDDPIDVMRAVERALQ